MLTIFGIIAMITRSPLLAQLRFWNPELDSLHRQHSPLTEPVWELRDSFTGQLVAHISLYRAAKDWCCSTSFAAGNRHLPVSEDRVVVIRYLGPNGQALPTPAEKTFLRPLAGTPDILNWDLPYLWWCLNHRNEP